MSKQYPFTTLVKKVEILLCKIFNINQYLHYLFTNIR